VKRRNDPTSAKVSNILGSYDKAKELVTSSHMIGAILQPATPRPSKQTFQVPAPRALAPPTSRSSHKHASSAKNGFRHEVSRQGVFEQFQQSSAGDKAADRLDTVVSASSLDGRSEKPDVCSGHVANGQHRSSSSPAGKRHPPKLSIPSPKVSTLCRR